MNEETSRGASAHVRAYETSTNLQSTEAARSGAEIGDSRNQKRPLPGELQRLVCEALAREQQTGKGSALWGRVGELYAAIRYGVKLSRRNAQGHDGRLGNDLVEIKTITPLKRKPFVRAKRAGNFSMIAVVRVRPDHHFEARIVRRDRLPTGNDGAYVVLSWSRACALAESNC
jgi:hypothetical protein